MSGECTINRSVLLVVSAMLATSARGQRPRRTAPIGPAWRDAAAKCKSVKGAQQQLTATVMAGSSPCESHWHGRVGGLAMPPNKVAIVEVEAARPVAWILVMEPVVNN